MGTLAGPRAVADDSHSADFATSGLALTRRTGGRWRLEYPAGRVLYESSLPIDSPRVSRDGRLVALDARRFERINRVAWLPDGKRLLHAFRPSVVPSRVFRIEVASSRRTLWREIMPRDLACVIGLYTLVMSPDGRSLFHSYQHFLSELYLVEGVKQPTRRQTPSPTSAKGASRTKAAKRPRPRR